MERHHIEARPDWQQRVHDVGLTHHTRPEGDQGSPPARPYWDEGTFYTVSEEEANILARAAHAVHNLTMDATERILTSEKVFGRFLAAEQILDPRAALLISDSWQTQQQGLADRIRLAWDPDTGQDPVLLSVDGERPFGVVEQAAQQTWAADTHPGSMQFADLDDALESRFVALRDDLGDQLHLALPSTDLTMETMANATRVADRAAAAGYTVIPSLWEGLTTTPDGHPTDHAGVAVATAYHPEPFATLMRHDHAEHVLPAGPHLRWFQPPWKSIVSSRFTLAALFAMFPTNSHLLPTYAGNSRDMPRFAAFPVVPSSSVTRGPMLYQQRPHYASFGTPPAVAMPEFEVWVVGGEPVALGIYDHVWSSDHGFSTRFVPHLLVD